MSKKQERWFLSGALVTSISVGPEQTVKMLVPLFTVSGCMLYQDLFQCAIETFFQTVTLGVVSCGVEFVYPKCLAYVSCEVG